MIRDEKTHQIKSLMQMGAKDGMFTMEKYLTKLVVSNQISKEDALACIPENTDDFEAMLTKETEGQDE